MSEEQMTEEQMKKEIEAYKKEWEDFNQSLKDNPDAPVTKGELAKAIQFISEDMGGLGQLTNHLGKNLNILAHNFQQLVGAIQGQSGVPMANKTKSGIILPH